MRRDKHALHFLLHFTNKYQTSNVLIGCDCVAVLHSLLGHMDIQRELDLWNNAFLWSYSHQGYHSKNICGGNLRSISAAKLLTKEIHIQYSSKWIKQFQTDIHLIEVNILHPHIFHHRRFFINVWCDHSERWTALFKHAYTNTQNTSHLETRTVSWSTSKSANITVYRNGDHCCPAD